MTAAQKLYLSDSIWTFFCLLQDQCSCHPPQHLEQGSTPLLSMEAWSCSVCSSSMIHRRLSKRQRRTHSMAYRNMTLSMRKSLQELKYTKNNWFWRLLLVIYLYRYVDLIHLFNLTGVWGFTWTHWIFSSGWWWF